MVLSRLRFFRRGLTTAVFREFGKVPERSEVFTTSKRSASKQLSTLLKKKIKHICGKCVKIAGWLFKVLYFSSKIFAIDCLKNRIIWNYTFILFEIVVKSVWPLHNLKACQSPFWYYWSSLKRRKQTHCICCQRAFHWESDLGGLSVSQQ